MRTGLKTKVLQNLGLEDFVIRAKSFESKH